MSTVWSRRTGSGGRVGAGVAGALVALAAVLALFVHGVGVDATFDGQIGGDQGAMSLTAVYAPSALVATSTSTDVGLTWAPGANGSGYLVLGGAADAQGQCTNVTFALIGSSATPAYTDTRSGPQGTSYCYMVQTALASWTSVSGNPTAVVGLGFVATSVTLENGGTANRLDRGDRFVVRFNRPVDPTTGPTASNTICATNTGTIVLGATATSGSCVATESNRLGTLTGSTHNTNVRFALTAAWSDTQTLTVTVGTRRSGSQGSSVGSAWTFTPTRTTTALLSVTNRTHVCDINSGGSNCLPRTTGTL